MAMGQYFWCYENAEWRVIRRSDGEVLERTGLRVIAEFLASHWNKYGHPSDR